MKTLDQIRFQLSIGKIDLSDHADLRLLLRSIDEVEIAQAGRESNILEDYPDDKYSPSCLLLGFTEVGRPLHILVSLADEDLLKVITVYEPDPAKCIDHAIRRR